MQLGELLGAQSQEEHIIFHPSVKMSRHSFLRAVRFDPVGPELNADPLCLSLCQQHVISLLKKKNAFTVRDCFLQQRRK